MARHHTVQARVRRLGARGKPLIQRTLSTVGLTHSDRHLASDAQLYWEDDGASTWKGNSHWRDADVFSDDGGDLWEQIGRRNLDLFDRYSAMLDEPPRWGRVLEWGCGGGMNAVHFAPRADEFVGVDVSTASLDECGRQVARVCATPYRPILIHVDGPERVLRSVDGPCDVFLSFYVFELIPTPEYGERLLRIAFELLRPGGVALIQTKYDEGRFSTRPMRRDYHSRLADMTTYRISDFWQLATACGFSPAALNLEPHNELDHRYAYYLLTKPAG